MSKATHNDPQTPPAWMGTVLRVAGVYNLLWGAATVLFPTQTLSLLGLSPLPTYPELWQCIGMIVGVYGIGYWFAANNAYVHWPIVLVGLLGKIFGPIGFASAVIQGRFPPSMGVTILTNDLIWWVPFTLMLFGAARSHQVAVMHQHRLTAKTNAEDLTDQHGRSFGDIVATGLSVVVFLRHAGCTFCRETLAEIQSRRPELDQSQATLVLVHMGDEGDDSRQFFDQYGLSEVARISDPGGLLYEAHDLGMGSFRQMFGPNVWWRGAKAFLMKRHGIGKLVGNGFQMPGSVVYVDGKVANATRPDDASYIPDVCQLASDAATQGTAA